MSTARRPRTLAIAFVLTLLGTLLVAGVSTPAASHVSGSVKHLWAKHIKPKADKRYYTKAKADARFDPAVMGFGETASGVWSASATADALDTFDITFDPPLPSGVTGHLLTLGSVNDSCPGVGQAAPGNLCVYSSFVNGMSFYGPGFHDPTTGGSGITVGGTVVILQGSQTFSNARGTWTVRAPLKTSRPVPKPAPAGPGVTTD